MVESEKKEKEPTSTKQEETESKKEESSKHTMKHPRSDKDNSDKDTALILWFEDLTNDDVAYVGGKNASLGEMYRELTPKGIKIPNGFAVTAYAYNHFLNECNLMDSLSEALEEEHIESSDLKKVGKKVRKLILDADFPDDLSKAILEAYKKLGGGDVAVRSSATAEDLPEASFAGQQESYLNVEGEEMVLEACKKCMASLFTNRAISYREDKGFNHFDVYLSVGVMKMVRSDKACAGTMFTIDTETGFANTIVVNGSWGLGENVVQGSVNPDEWTIFKPTLNKDSYKPLIRKVLGSKKQFMVYGGEEKFCLEDDEVLQLAKWGMIIEDHYTKRKGKFCPMDIEWAKDGNTNEIFIVQARPETVQSQKNLNMLISYKLKGKRKADEGTLEETTKENAKELKKGGNEEEAEKAKQKVGGSKGKEKEEEGKEEGKGKKEEGKEKEGSEKEEKGKKADSDEKKSYKKPRSKGKKKPEEDKEDEGESEDDLKLHTRKKNKTDKKEDNELIQEAKKEGKGEQKGDAKDDKEGKEKESKQDEKAQDKDKQKDKKKEKEKGEGEKEGKDKEGKDKEGKEKEEKEGKEKGEKKKGKFEGDAARIAMARHEEFSKAGKKEKDDKKEKEKREKKDKGDKKEGDKKEESKGKDEKGDKEKQESEHKESEEKILTSGAAVGSAIASGKARKILSVSKLKEFNKGEILVTEMTDPDWEPILKLAAAIITDSGGRTCHAAIIARELGIPCIVGCSDATSKIETGDAVTVDCARGDQGVVLEGLYDFEKTEQDLGDLIKTKTKIMMNVANPGRALELSFIPCAGVGLGRLEFIVNNHIGIHPLAVLHLDDVEEEEKAKILERARGYKDPREFFVSTLAHGVGMISAAFYPKPVIVRFSDFKTNEYANLIGGKHYEPKEDNPMLGWRGASRYYDPTYREGFALECAAMRRVREEFGLTNLRLMIPMLRTVDEAKRVLEEMEKNGIKKSEGDEGLKVMAMCEVPSNCILAEEFLELLDGFSIGSNDLTQMTLGVDRDSEIVNDIFDERNEAVKTMISHAIKVCRKLHKYVGICGQAPSDYPEFAKWLVDEGIESMSLNPDTVLPTTLLVSQRERGLSDEEIEKENKEKEKKAKEKVKKEKEEQAKKAEEKKGKDKKDEKGKGKEEKGKEERGKEKGKEEKGKEEKGKDEKRKDEKGKDEKGKEEGKAKSEKDGKREKDSDKNTNKNEDKEKEKDKKKDSRDAGKSKDKEKGDKTLDKEKGEKIEEIHKQLDEISEKVGDLSNELHELSGGKKSSDKPAL